MRKSSRNLTALVVVALGLGFCIRPAEAQSDDEGKPTFRISAQEGPKATKKVSLIAARSGKVEFNLEMDDGGKGKLKLRLALKEFAAQEGSDVPNALVRFAPEVEEEEPSMHKEVVMGPGVFPVLLVASNLRDGISYEGEFQIIDPEGGDLLDRWTMTIRRESLPLGTLLVSRSKRIRKVTKSFWPESETIDAEIHVQLCEKSKNKKIDGVKARLKGDSESPSGDFEPGSHLKFLFNDEEAELLRSPEAAGVRSIEPGEQAEVTLQLMGLESGKHEFTLQFDGLNTVEGSETDLEVILFVKDHMAWTIICLLGAGIISYMLTRGFKNWRTRINLRYEISQLRKEWLYRLYPILPVVWTKATLKQCALLTERFLLGSSLALINERLNKVKLLIDILQEYHEQLALLTHLHDMVKFRLQGKLNQVMKEEMDDPENIDSQKKEIVLTKLMAVRELIKEPAECYWTQVDEKRKELIAEFDKNLFPDNISTDDRDKIEQKVIELRGKPRPGGSGMDAIREMIKVDELYAKLRILWERKDAEEIADLVEMVINDEHIDEIFSKADGKAWERFRKAYEADQVWIETPSRTMRALTPERFHLEFDDQVKESLIQTHLIQFGLKWRWNCSLWSTSKGDRGKKADWFTYTRSPRSYQFGIDKGYLKTEVVVQYDGEECILKTVDGKLVKVGSDWAFTRMLKGLMHMEVLALLIASAVAVFTGLKTYYVDSDTFGSLKDYIVLALWGIGFDQGKNFLGSITRIDEWRRPPP